ncbi:MAG: cytochrome c oxidase assembly protein [Betaproteobacteria bacterium]
MTPTSAVEAPNKVTLRKLLVIVVLMFGFGYAMVPFYKKICQATGLYNLLQPEQVSAANTQVDTSRTVIVEFDANTRQLPWDFKPEIVSIKAHPGQLVHVNYDISNTTDRAIIGQAIPAYAPQVAGRYFHKLECFCFSKQALGPRESRRMPVVFVVDPQLPADVHTITLSYTFFEISNGVTAARKS